MEGGAPVTVDLQAVERQSGDQAWANYVLGVLHVLRTEGLEVTGGFDLEVVSTLPVGAGLSSSAALELATAFALNDAFNGGFDRGALARMSQRAENEFVGVPCGLLDQAVVAFGNDDRIVRLDAHAKEVTTVPFPTETRIWIFQTHQSHALADAHYQERHDEARAAREALDEVLKGSVETLAAVPPDALEEAKGQIPEVLYRRARHVSTEHRRVQSVVQHLEEHDHRAAGELLFASHESSRTDYDNSTDELDFVVDRLAETDHVLGGRLTGAGFGGAVMAWTQDAFGDEEATAIVDAYANRFGEDLTVLACQTGPGAFSEDWREEA
jgi:galactokinase